VNAAWRGDRGLVAAALRGGTAPDFRAPDGHTALLRAVRDGHIACAELLLSAGASPATPNPDPQGGTALILAATFGHTEIVRALLDAGACTADRDAAGRTALHAACWGGHAAVAELLVAAGADRWARDRSGRLPADEARRWCYHDLARWAVSRTWTAAAPSRGAAGG
jgi:ankyrin repeat protein